MNTKAKSKARVPDPKSEGRPINPKSEGRNPKEGRDPKSEIRTMCACVGVEGASPSWGWEELAANYEPKEVRNA